MKNCVVRLADSSSGSEQPPLILCGWSNRSVWGRHQLIELQFGLAVGGARSTLGSPLSGVAEGRQAKVVSTVLSNSLPWQTGPYIRQYDREETPQQLVVHYRIK